MVSFSFKAVLALSMLSGASARLGGYPESFEDLVQSDRELKGPPEADGCHTCDCFTCDNEYHEDNFDGTITIRIQHCKTTDISWMCCVGVDDQVGNCNVNDNVCTPEAGTSKCNGIDPDDGFQLIIPKTAEHVTINTHDGKTAGDADVNNEACGGNGNQGGAAGCEDPTPHCLLRFNIKDDCGYHPGITFSDEDPEPEPAPSPAVDPAPIPGFSFDEIPEPAPTAPAPEPVTPVSPAAPDPVTPSNPEPATPSNPEPATPVTPSNPEPAPAPAPDAPEPVGPPGSYGDPHVKTWNGGAFDFHGACDLVLMNNPTFHDGLGMRIHIRTSIVSWWSYIARAAFQVGDDIMEITGSDQEGTYYINGVEGSSNRKEQFHFSAANLKIDVYRVTKKQLKLRVELLNGDRIGFETYKTFVRVNVKENDPKWNKFAGSLGLMGAHPSGETIGRDGKTLFTDMNAFGQEWQVRGDEPMLFREVKGPQHPQQCQMPETVTTEEKRRRLGESAITMEDAEEACARVTAQVDRDACIFDVLATNDKDMAGSY